jgi:U3 small nucleolar ribonucleoprotein component
VILSRQVAVTDMSQQTMRFTKPEEEELSKKKVELSQLESDLADQELCLTVSRSELSSFERNYVRIVGKLYAELDEIEARIEEQHARLHPTSTEALYAAVKARDRASVSHATVEKSLVKGQAFVPPQSQTLKNLYREVAKRIHPDLTTDSGDRARRQQLMADANKAYEEGDEARLRAILEEYELSPESVTGEGTAAELVRVIRKIAQARKRLVQIEREVQELQKSELFALKTKVDRAAGAGRDLLAEMAEDLNAQIAISRGRLNNLSTKQST